jgi:RimJ/RimL family protein N-acetyltransferase
MNTNFEFNGYQMRLIQESHADTYYKTLLESDEESKYFTGTTGTFTREQIAGYITKVVSRDNRYDFIILKDDDIVGEVVLSDVEGGKCHYRICIFKKENFSKGIGFEATKKAFDFAFNELELEEIELEVFPFNERGIALYEKMGFEFIETIVDEEAEDPYCEVNLMLLKKKRYSI